jgi:hypothetical protein
MVECLPSKCEAPGSNPSTTIEIERERMDGRGTDNMI